MKLSAFSIICLTIMIYTQSAMATEFDIKISIVEPEGNQHSTGSGRFATTDTAYGRIAIAFYGDESNFMVRTFGTRQFPVTYLNSDDNTAQRSNELVAITDFILRPSVTKEKQIRLRGVVNKIIRTDLSDANSFTYSEEKLDFTLPDSGGHIYEFHIGKKERFVTLKIEVSSSDDMVYEEKIYRQATYKCQYELLNESTGENERKSTCYLGISLDGDGNGSCSNRNLFKLENGDSLLYLRLFEIRETAWNKDSTITLTFEFSRIYALNPENPQLSSEEIRSDKTLVKVFEKKIVTRPGETTIVEIAPDKESPLPFSAKEVVRISTELKVTRD